MGKPRHRAVRWAAFHCLVVGSPHTKPCRRELRILQKLVLCCAYELARTWECVFQKTYLEGLLYCSRIKVNENDTALVKHVSYLIYSVCQAPVQEQTPSAPHFWDTMLCDVRLSLLGEFLSGFHLQEIWNPAVPMGFMISLLCLWKRDGIDMFSKGNSLISGYGIHNSTGYRYTYTLHLSLSLWLVSGKATCVRTVRSDSLSLWEFGNWKQVLA